ncbi:DUF423 domain-containing protein [Rhabdaerophilum sp. SD176]|uniref:DUF423 domain-containing protein n=1 Tax=Rhabdaerophilum sp. SD176 TaxID=2983548 RepID=UPI0024DFEC37|nr:DUF423 domain-containing protein [Rhabdaerophilum sp. SD176]
MRPRLALALAGLSGALGVVLSAMSTHYPGGFSLGIAGTFLLIHAAAFLALGALAGNSPAAGAPISAIGLGWALGLALFCGDLAARVFLGTRLFPGAAPAGGILLILAWAGLGLVALLPRR